MNSRWVDLPSEDGGSFKGYLSIPPTGRGPGVLLIQEIFGVNAHIQAVADQYAMDGFTVLAPDIFWRLEPGVQLGYQDSDFAKGIALMRKADFPHAVRDLAMALKMLRGLPYCTGKVASLGYCMGGRLSFHLAAATDVDAAVCYYGGGIHTALDQAAMISAPILFHFAANDGFIPPEAVAAVRDTFADRPGASIHIYDGVDHGFNCWDRGMYDQRASAIARAHTLHFLAANISA